MRVATAEQRILDWLRSVVAGAPAQLGPLTDEEARLVCVEGLAGLAVGRGATHDLLAGIERTYYLWDAQQQILAGRALCALMEAGIPAAVMKGSPLAVRFWGDAAARMSSDVDILVEQERVDDARSALEGGGLVFCDRHPQWYSRAWFYHAQYRDPMAGNQMLELHWDFKRRGYRRTPVSDMLAAGQDVECGVRRLVALDGPWQLIVTCVGAVGHGLPLRNLVDVALICRTFSASDWAAAIDHASRCGVDQLFHLVVTASAHRLEFVVDPLVARLRPRRQVARHTDRMISELPAFGRLDRRTVDRLRLAAALALGPRALRLLAVSAAHRPLWMWMRRSLPPDTARKDR